MKKNKIIGIVLIVIGLFCVFGAFSVNSGAPETAETISNAVYVSDGKVLPENEGCGSLCGPGNGHCDP